MMIHSDVYLSVQEVVIKPDLDSLYFFFLYLVMAKIKQLIQDFPKLVKEIFGRKLGGVSELIGGPTTVFVPVREGIFKREIVGRALIITLIDR